MSGLATPLLPPQPVDVLVFVAGVTKDVPIYHHLPNELPSNETMWDQAECGKTLSWSMKNALIPERHARKFAAPCRACVPE